MKINVKQLTNTTNQVRSRLNLFDNALNAFQEKALVAAKNGSCVATVVELDKIDFKDDYRNVDSLQGPAARLAEQLKNDGLSPTISLSDRSQPNAPEYRLDAEWPATVTDTDEYAQRVQKGMEFLDAFVRYKSLPEDWWQRISRVNLDLGDGECCILGQLAKAFGVRVREDESEYDRTRIWMGLSDDESIKLGFTVGNAEDLNSSLDSRDRRFKLLTDAWVKAITDKLSIRGQR